MPSQYPTYSGLELKKLLDDSYPKGNILSPTYTLLPVFLPHDDDGFKNYIPGEAGEAVEPLMVQPQIP